MLESYHLHTALQVVGNTISGNCISGGVGGLGIDFCDGEVVAM